MYIIEKKTRTHTHDKLFKLKYFRIEKHNNIYTSSYDRSERDKNKSERELYGEQRWIK